MSLELEMLANVRPARLDIIAAKALPTRKFAPAARIALQMYQTLSRARSERMGAPQDFITERIVHSAQEDGEAFDSVHLHLFLFFMIKKFQYGIPDIVFID